MNILHRYDERIRSARGLSADAFYVQELERLEEERAALSHLLDVAYALLPTNPANDLHFTGLRAALARVSA